MPAKFKIVFMGTPEFAVPTLLMLLEEENVELTAVITSPDKPGGRGRKNMLQSAVKKTALAKGLTVLQPRNLKDPDFVEMYRNLNIDLAVVVAFRMLPEVIWSAPKLGTINLHGSLLPAYRGAAPINWAIINGEKETGLTTFLIAKEIDTGGIIYQVRIPIEEYDNAGTLHDKMMLVGANLVRRTVRDMLAGQVTYVLQDDSKATKAPKIYTEDCQLDPNQPVKDLFNFVRGLSPYPTAWIKLGGVNIKLFVVKYQEVISEHSPGTLISDGKSYLRVYGKDGYLSIEELQMEGKKRMDIKSFLNGFDVRKLGDIILEIG